LVLAPNGNLLTANGDAINPNPNEQSEIVEFTPAGVFIGEFSAEPAAAGAAFGLAMQTIGSDVRLAAVDDNLNVLDIWTTDLPGTNSRSTAGNNQETAVLERLQDQLAFGGAPIRKGSLGADSGQTRDSDTATASSGSALTHSRQALDSLNDSPEDGLLDGSQTSSTSEPQVQIVERLFTMFDSWAET
jgi:hypothetical protein